MHLGDLFDVLWWGNMLWNSFGCKWRQRWRAWQREEFALIHGPIRKKKSFKGEASSGMWFFVEQQECFEKLACLRFVSLTSGSLECSLGPTPLPESRDNSIEMAQLKVHPVVPFQDVPSAHVILWCGKFCTGPLMDTVTHWCLLYFQRVIKWPSCLCPQSWTVVHSTWPKVSAG